MTGHYLKPHICIDCGVEFQGGPMAQRCPSCRQIRRTITQRESQTRRNHGVARKVGSADLCAKCGAEYTVNSGPQKYCPACMTAIDAECSRKYRPTTEDVKQRHRDACSRWSKNNRVRINARRRSHAAEKNNRLTDGAD